MFLALGSVSMLVGAACGIGQESEAHVFSAGEVPSGILDRSFEPTTTVNGTTTSVPTTTYRLFLVRDTALYEVTRTWVGVPSLSTVIDALVQGPTSSEILSGYRSALGNATVVSSVRANGALAQVDLARSFSEIPRSDQALAIGQITLTLTDRPDVVRVQFTQLNLTIDVPKGDKSLTHEPVGADDFKALVKLPTAPTTTLGGSGATGDPGASGATGPSGATGASGASGATGASGASGASGVSGASLANGASTTTRANRTSGA
jgi:hypothetical protein